MIHLLEVDLVAAPLNGFPRFSSRFFISVAENYEIDAFLRELTFHVIDST